MSTRWWVVLSLAAVAGAQPAWTPRYANYPNIPAADKARGSFAGYTVTVGKDDTGEVITVDGDKDGKRIGHVYLGRPLDLPSPRPRFLTIALELQGYDAEPERTANLTVFLLSQAGWDRLGREPKTEVAPNPWQAGDVIASQPIDYPEDTVTWLPWHSRNLAQRLNPQTPEHLWLVLDVAGNHSNAEEWAKFRKIEVSMSQTPPPPPVRTRQWPLKQARGLHTDAELALARQRVQTDPEAQKILAGLKASCDYWLAVPFADLTWRLPDSSVPRAFNESVAGCPIHGQAINKFGTYPWKFDFNKPFKCICPIGGEEYPSNDFLRYYQSGYQDKTALGGPYSDDGWGWTPPGGGEKHWLVAHANHWHWMRYAIPGLLNLSRVYLLTGDRKYAHQAAAMLARVADIYPAMDHEFQSRYGSISPGYSGKIVNHIWETGVIENFAEAYDNLWDAIDGDTELQTLRKQTGEQIRDLIERNVIEEGIASILDGHIQGNFGMHQRALATLVAVRQQAPAREVLANILDKTGAEGRYEGIRYALYNLVYRDGVPEETSPGYNDSWVENLTDVARQLDRAGVDLFAEPQFRRLLQWPIDLIVNDRFTPAIGDSSGIHPGIVGTSFSTYREAMLRYGGPDFAYMLAKSGGATRTYSGYDGLFEAPVAEQLKQALAAQPRPKAASRVLDGYGLVVLNNPADSVGVSSYYGYRGGHSHHDGQTMDLFALGQAMTPDTGYPDAMNAFVPGIFSWSKATIAHNTVTVDAQQQSGNAGGQVRGFAATPWVQYSDVDAPGNYPGLKEYRRALVLISTDDQNAYLVDLFRVDGGKQHDYSLHGNVGERTIVDGSFSPPQTQGTLAGENVAVGQFYDDPKFDVKGYSGGYGGYLGSGFQHLISVQRQQGAGPVTVQVDAAEAPKIKLRMHVLPQDGQQVILAQARVSPVNHPELLPYLLARRTGDALKSTFVTVLDPYATTPQVTRVEKLPAPPEVVALRIERPAGVDLLLQTRHGGSRCAAGDLTTDAALAVVRLKPDGSVASVMGVGGTYVELAGKRSELKPPVTGTIGALDAKANTVTVTWNGPAPADAELVGQSLLLGNATRGNLFKVTAAKADGAKTVLTVAASLLNGHGRVKALDEAARTLTTDTQMVFQPLYAGMRVTNDTGTAYLPIESAGGGVFKLKGTGKLADLLGADAAKRREFWVSVVGPGDTVRWERATVGP